MNKNKYYSGIDWMRLIAAVLVITIHTSPLASYNTTGDFILTRVIARVAVPFFFMTTGYFTLSRYHYDNRKLLGFLKKTGIIYVAAIAVYLPLNIYNGYFNQANLLPNMLKDLVFDGTLYHLWYLPASMLGMLIAWQLVQKLDYSKGLIVAGLLYLIGLFGDSYYGIAVKLPGVKSIYDLLFELFDYTRNGIFFAPVFLMLGGLIAEKKRRMTQTQAIVGLIGSFLLLIAEAMLLHKNGFQRHDSMYVFLLPCMVFLFHFVLHFRGKQVQGLRISLVYLIVGILDWAYQKHRFNEEMKMTKQEVREEFKNTEGNPESVPEATAKTAKMYNWLFEQTMSYNKEIHGHSLSALVGWTMQYQRDESTYAFANGFITNSVPTLNAGTVTRGNSHASEWALLSGLARIQYNYKGKYMLTGAIRADGASRFGKQNRWGWFPSVSAGWRLTEEQFMKSLTFIDDLKLRASYGLTGNFRIPNYGAQGEVAYYSYVLGGSNAEVIKGAAPKSMPNPELHWEKTAQVNVGFDASLFSNRLTLGLDLYNSNTYDLLLNVPVPMTTGYNTRLENIGKVNNKGVEFNIATNQKMGDFNWSVYFNISKNINEVKELGPGNADIISSGSVSNAYFITRVGEAIGSYYLPVVEGVYKNQAEVDAALHYKDSPTNYGLADTKPGDFKFKDVNGDGILDISDTDRAIVGNYMPDFTYGFGATLAWKGIDFGIVFQGVQGNEILNLSRRYFYNHEGNMNNYKGALNRWKSEDNPGSGMNVRANRVSKGQNGTTSTWHVEDGSYLRIKNISLGYTLPENWLKKVYLKSARVYCSIQNPFTFTNYEGYNPEVSNRSAATTNGEDYGVYPLARTTSIGVNLTF